VTDFLDLSLCQAAELTRTGAVSAVEIVTAALERLDRVEPQLQAFAVIDADGAMQTAKQLDSTPESERGLLHGLPIAIKDIFDVQGLATRRGSRAFETSAPASADAESVRRLRSAGAVIIGKTRTHELAFGVYTPPTRNPWDLRRSPGGSSGGSAAAVAARLVYAATGSDSGGSIRIPAALCGIVGFKPTYGRITRAGVATLSWSLDHLGPLTRTVDDAWALLEVLCGEDPHDPATAGQPPLENVALGERRLRLGVIREVFQEGLTAEVAAVWGGVIDSLTNSGVDVIPVEVPHIRGALAAQFAIVLSEAASYYESTLRERRAEIGDRVRSLLEAGLAVPATTYLRAQRARAVLQAEFRDAFEHHRLDAVLAPTVPGTAQFHDQSHLQSGGVEEAVGDAFIRTTGPFNLTGAPVVAIPAGLGDAGLPVGVQLAGPPYGEGRLRAVAVAVQQIIGPQTLPPLPQTPRSSAGISNEPASN
jgi:aspartyl-tRNA(Asn)/glutamyl-tRNA(Gln) amidotransferase subunit A